MMRILVAGFQHETNTFAPSKTGYVDFVRGGAFPAMVHGADVLALRDVNIPMGGFIRAMEGLGVELVPVLWAGATPAAREDARLRNKLCHPFDPRGRASSCFLRGCRKRLCRHTRLGG